MIDTPRTDAAAGVTFDPHGKQGLVPVHFARTLERELAQATKERDEARAAVREILAECDCIWIASAMERWRKAAGLEPQ